MLFISVFPYLIVSGCLWWSGEILWRKFQNNTSVCVFPSVCALCESIQGKVINHLPPLIQSQHYIICFTSFSHMNRNCMDQSCYITPKCLTDGYFFSVSKQRRIMNRGKDRSKWWWRSWLSKKLWWSKRIRRYCLCVCQGIGLLNYSLKLRLRLRLK